KRYFLRLHPGVQRSAIHTVSAPLKGIKPTSISTLARVNGAQIAIVMKAFPQLDGALIHAVMSIPTSYEDFRTNPVEILNLDFEGKRISLDIPSRYVVLDSLFLTNQSLQMYKDGQYRDLCPIDRCDVDQPPNVVGKCLRLGVDIPLSYVVRYLHI